MHTISSDRDAAFNITEGQDPLLGANTHHDASTIQIDLTHIPAGTEATLVLRLVNNDSDTTSTVTITDIEIVPGSLETPLGISYASTALAAEQAIDFAHLQDVTGALNPVYGTTSFNDSQRVLYADLMLHNTSSFVVDGPLIAVINHLSDPQVQVLNADGFTADDLPYVDITAYLSDGSLPPDASTTASQVLAFLNPAGTQFTYDLVLLGYLNDAPEFISEPGTEALPGKPYTYVAQAVDPNGDTLTYSLVMAPEGMVIDGASGEISWTPANGDTDLGTYDILIRVDDARGASAQQRYVLNVIVPPPNRPPIITSIPVTEAELSEDSREVISEPVQTNLESWEPVVLTGCAYGHDRWGTPTHRYPDWDVEGDQVVQRLNADASMLISDFELFNERIEGTWRVNTPDPENDDDWIGFVFGYQDSQHFYLFDWKRGAINWFGAHSEVGMAVKVVNSPSALTSYDLANTDGSTGKVTTLYKNNIAWQKDRDYRFILDFNPGVFTITVLDGETVLMQETFEDLTYSTGKFGFYNYSQGNVLYKGFRTQQVDNPSYYYKVEATDPDFDAISFSLTEAPEGMKIHPVTGEIVWLPSVEQVGTHLVSVEAVDPYGARDTQSFMVTVLGDPENHAPIIISEAITTATAGEDYVYDVEAIDPDADTVTYSLAQAPDGMTIDPASGMIQWTPSEDILAGDTVVFSDSDFDAEDWEEQVVEIGGGGTATVTYESDGDNQWISIYVRTNLPLNDADVPQVYQFLWNNSAVYDPQTKGAISSIDYSEINRATSSYPSIDSALAVRQDGHIYVLRANQARNSDWTEFSLSELTAEDFLLLNPNDPENEGVPLHPDFTSSGSEIQFGLSCAISGSMSEYTHSALDKDTDDWQVVITPKAIEHVEVIVRDDRGGQNTQTYSIDISRFGTLQGYVYHDQDQDGIWDHGADLYSYNWGNNLTTRYHGRTGTVIDVLPEYLKGGVFVGQDGYLYQVENIRTTYARICRFDAQTGELIEKLAIFDDTVSAFSKMIQGPDGDFYASSQALDAIVKFDGTTGQYLGIFAQHGTLSNPVGILFDGNGDLWTCNVASPYGYVLKFDGQTGEYIALLANLSHTFDMAWGLDGNAYVTDGGYVTRLDGETGASMGRFITTRVFTGWGATIAIGPNGNIYVTSRNEDQYGVIREYDGVTGDFVGEFVVEDELSRPAFIAFTPDQSEDDIEETLSGWIIYLDQNRNGRRDSWERWSTTDAEGRYVFDGISAGTYWVAQEAQDGWLQVTPGTGCHDVTVGEDETVYQLDFGFTPSDDVIENVSPEIYTDPTTSAMVDQVYVYDANAFDANGDDLTFDLVVAPDGMIIDAQMGAVAWIPDAGQLGTYDVILRVQDGAGGVDVQSWQIVVETPNIPPVIVSAPSLQAVADLPYQYQIQAQDPEGQAITYGLAKAPEGMTVDADTGLVSWTASIDQIGSHEVIVSATDERGETTLQPYDLEVVATAPNDVPVITSTPRTRVRLGNTYGYLVQASDSNGDPLTFSLISAPDGMTIDALQGVVFWTPTADQFGEHAVQIQVSDGRGGIAEQSFTLAVTASDSNTAPVITSQPRDAAVVDQMYAHDLTANDPDGDPVAWFLVEAPLGMSINEELGTLRWTPTLDQLGSQTVTVQAIDPFGAVAQQTFTINVRSTNLAPQIYSVAKTQAFVDSPYTYQVLARDIEGDGLTFSLPTAPDGMTIDPETGQIGWTPTVAQVGNADVSVQVEDSHAAIATQNYTIVVAALAINQAPTITSTPQRYAREESLYQYQVTAVDPEGQPVEFYLLQAPMGMTIDRDTGQIDWTPTVYQNGPHTITVAALDSEGASGQQQYTLTVRANQAPTIVSTPIAAIKAGMAYHYQVLVEDADDTEFTYALTIAPEGMTVDELGRIQWQTTLADHGDHNVTIEVADPLGATTEQSFTVTVAQDTTAPTVMLAASGSLADPGDSVTFQVRATDDVGLESVVLLIDGEVHALDSYGSFYRAEITFETPGLYDVVARATDVSGNEGFSTTRQVRVFDPADQDHPVVTIHSPEYQDIITYLTDVVISVQDDNLSYWKVEYAPANKVDITQLEADDPDYILLAEGTDPVDQEVVTVFDPTILANDAYVMRVTAYDVNGAGWVEPLPFGVSGNAKLGNFTFTLTDLSVPLVGIPITINRTYDTLQVNSQGDFGYGWSLSIADADIAETTPEGYEMQFGDRVYLTDPNGQRIGFTYEPVYEVLWLFGAIAHPVFTPDPGVSSTLTVKEGAYGVAGILGAFGGDWNPSHYVLTMQDGTAYEYIQGQGLQQITDANGNVVSFTDAAITHSSGAQIELIRDPQGRIVEIVDPAGNSVHYTYDAAADLVGFTNQVDETTTYEYLTDPAHFLDSIYDATGTRIFKAEFDDDGRLASATDALGNVTQQDFDTAAMMGTQTDVLGNVTEIYYDEQGNIVATTDPLGNTYNYTYDENGDLLSETNPLGHVTSLTYDNSGNLLTKTDPLGNTIIFSYDSSGNTTSITDPLGNTYSYVYDSNGNLISEIDPLGNQTSKEYDTAGNIIAETDQLGYVTRYEYDALGNRIAEIDALGHRTEYAYDTNGNPTSETKARTDSEGIVHAITTTSDYDALGRLIAVTDALGHTTTYEYGANGLLAAAVDYLGRRTEYEYDASGDLIRTSYWNGAVEETTYDAKGNKIEETDIYGQTTSYEYDALDRETRRVEPDGDTYETEYDAAGHISAAIANGQRWEYEHDAGHSFMIQDVSNQRARIVESTSPDGTSASVDYDANGNVTAITGTDGSVQEIIYDAMNRPLAISIDGEIANEFQLDAKGALLTSSQDQSANYTYEYDALGRLIQVTDPLGNQTTYTYDELGNKLSQTDANSNVTLWEYDNVGRVIERTLPLGMSETQIYNDEGYVSSTTDFNGDTTTFAYNDLGQLITKTYADGSTVSFTYTEQGNRLTVEDSLGTTSYEYDDFGRTTRVTNPDGSSVEYTYTEQGQRESVATQSGTTYYAYDVNGALSTVTGPDGSVTTYEYDSAERTATIHLPNGTAITTYFDSNQRTSEIYHLDSSGVVFEQFLIDYEDAEDNTRTITEANRTVVYTYDELHRLIEEHIVDGVHGDQTITYTYDHVGNRLSKTDADGTTQYTYDANNRLLTAGEWTYTYDNNGNMIQKTTGSETWSYEYDYENRLVKVIAPDGSEILYSYDCDGVLVSRTEEGVAVTYTVDKEVEYHHVLEEIDDAGTVIRSYVYGDKLIYEIRDGQDYYYHGDHLNTTRVLTDGSGNVVARYAFNAFGNALWQEGAVETAYQLAGEPVDESTGLQYLRARWLDVETSRFATMDDYQGNPQDPFSINAYLYANSDSSSNIDPSGHSIMGGYLKSILVGLDLVGCVYDSVIALAVGSFTPLILQDVKAASSKSVHTHDITFGLSEVAGISPGVFGTFGSVWGTEKLTDVKDHSEHAYFYHGITFSLGVPAYPWLNPLYASVTTHLTGGNVYNVFEPGLYTEFFFNVTVTVGPKIAKSYSVWGDVWSSAEGWVVEIPPTVVSASVSFTNYWYLG